MGGRSEDHTRHKVLFVTSGIVTTGGIQRYCRELTAALDEVCTVESIDISRSGFTRILDMLRVVASIVLSRPRLVIFGHLNLAILGVVAKVVGIKYVVLVYGREVWGNPSRSNAVAIRLASEVWTISEFTRSQLRTRYPDAKRTKIIGAAVDERWFCVEHKRPTKFRVLSVARLDDLEEKGIALCIDAVSQLPVEVELEYVVVGGGAAKVDLDDAIASLALGRIMALGPVGDAALAEEYAKASVLLLATPVRRGSQPTGEGLGLVVLEAAAAGVPAIVSRAGGLVETVSDGSTGVIVEPNDTKGIVTALTRLVNSPELVDEMGANAKRRCAELFSQRTFSRRVGEVTRELLDGRRET